MSRRAKRVGTVAVVIFAAAAAGSSWAGEGVDTWRVRHTASDYVYFDVAWGNGAFAAVGQGQSVLWSEDGATWATATVPPPIDPNAFNDNFLDVSFDGSILLASGFFDGTVVSSENASVWSNVSALPGTSFDTIAGNGARVVVGGEGNGSAGALIFTSDDGGVTFTEVTPGTGTGSFQDVDNIPGGFVALGWSFNGATYTNKVFHSADGVVWSTEVTAQTGDRLNAIELGNGMFVAVGYGGSILSSPEGLVWTARNSGTEETLFDVAFGNGVFVAVGGNGVILSSIDGVLWTPRASGTAYDLRGVGFGEDTFVVCGVEDPLSQNTIFLQSDPVTILFADGFELGTTDGWSAVTGNEPPAG